MIGIYQIKNKVNNKLYIGQSIDIDERIQEHKLIPYRTSTIIVQKYPLYQAIKKYGIDNFEFTVLQLCEISQLDTLESYWIKKLNTYFFDTDSNGYNLTRGGDGHRIISDEQITEIVNLWNEGLATGEISLLTNIEKHAIIRYLKEYSDYTAEESTKRGHKNSSLHHCKMINVYDKYGKLIKQYQSVQLAGEELNINNKEISAVVSGRKPSYKGMFFIDSTQNQLQELVDRMSRQKPPAVLEVDSTGEKILNIFFTKQEIKDYLQQENIYTVQPCCKGHYKMAYGHYWTYLYKYLEKHGFPNCG